MYRFTGLIGMSLPYSFTRNVCGAEYSDTRLSLSHILTFQK